VTAHPSILRGVTSCERAPSQHFAGAHIDQLVSIAAKVVTNQEKNSKSGKKNLEKKAKILAMALKDGDKETKGQRGGPNKKGWKNPLGRNQCTYSKEEEHWKDECPNKETKEKVTTAATKSKEAYNL
jgi:hypothetical protein